MPKRKTCEEFLKELEEINKNITTLEEYKCSLDPILCQCKKDGYKWKARPSDLLKGKGCPKCAGNIKKTHEEFLKEMNDVDSNIIIKSRYTRATARVSCKCKIDGHEWDATANNLLRGYGCPVCGKTMKMTYNDFLARLNKVNNDIDIIGEYVDSQTPILCRCKIDGHKWYVTPTKLLSGSHCAKCIGNLKKTQQEFEDELFEINPNISILSEYINYDAHVLCKCKIDGNEWYATPNNLLSYRGCPKCKKSKGERIVENFLISNNINYESQYKFDDLFGIGGGLLSYDFYLADYNLLVEVQGRQHKEVIDFFGGEEKFKIQKEHDTRKKRYVKSNNIGFLEIWYNEFDKIDEILRSRLLKQSA